MLKHVLIEVKSMKRNPVFSFTQCQVMNRKRFFEKFSKSEEGNGPQNKSGEMTLL